MVPRNLVEKQNPKPTLYQVNLHGDVCDPLLEPYKGSLLMASPNSTPQPSLGAASKRPLESCDFAGGWVSLLPRGSLIGQQSSPPLPGLSDWAADKDSEAAHPFPAKCSHMRSGHLKNYPTHGQLGKWASKTHSHQRGDRPCAKCVLAAFHVVRVTACVSGS